MPRRLLITLSLIAAFSFLPAMQSTASARIELSEIDNQAIKIELSGNSIIITGAAGKTVKIYNLIGVEVMSVRIDSNEKRIDLNNLKRGIYPVKVGNVSKKLHIGGK